MTALSGLWGALIPFIGPTFGYSADGSTAWRMTSAHLWLALIPGAVAFIAGIWMLLAAPRIATGSGKSALSIAGMLAAVSGAWFVVGPLSWPVVTTAPHYFLPSSPPRELGFQVGYALGIGVLIIAAGVFTSAGPLATRWSPPPCSGGCTVFTRPGRPPPFCETLRRLSPPTARMLSANQWTPPSR